MVYYLSEDPRPLAYALGLVALGFLAALWITQQGKYLIRAGIAVTLALAVLGIEHFWITDSERIEAVVYDLARAVEASDTERALSHLAPDVAVVSDDRQISRQFGRLKGQAVIAPDAAGASGDRQKSGRLGRLKGQIILPLIRQRLQDTKFDYLRIVGLTAHAGEFSRQGTAEFRTQAMGSTVGSASQLNFATPPAGIEWSLGFRETSPGVWKVIRITPIKPPPQIDGPLGIPSL
jgi:hypothetical protein